jgi:hypothetical protein
VLVETCDVEEGVCILMLTILPSVNAQVSRSRRLFMLDCARYANNIGVFLLSLM